MEQFSDRGLIESNLEGLYRERVERQNKDMTVLVCGAPGNGKSGLTWESLEWLAENIEKITFNWDKVAFTHEGWIDNEQNQLEKYEGSWYDEGYNTFHKRNAMTTENKEGISHLNQYRFKHHPRFINFQDIKNIETDLLFSEEIGVELLLRCVQQGWVHGYSQKTIQRIEFADKNNGATRVKWPTPDFRDGFPNPAQVYGDKWGEYEQVNEKKVKKGEEGYTPDDNELSIGEMAKVVKQKQDRYRKEYHGREYIDHELIEVDFDVGGRISRKVKKLAEADLGLG